MTGDWFGVRSELEARGIHLDATLTVDGIRNFSGGITADWGHHHLLDVGLTLDLEQMMILDGATVFAGFYTNGGDGLNSEIVGDLQFFSNITDRSRTQLDELWYEQRLLNDRLRLKIGKVEANDEFAFVENATHFTQSSMGLSPTVFVMPTYPDPAMSINLFAQPNDYFSASLGIYDGALARGVATGKRGPNSFFHAFDDLFLIGEVGFRWNGSARAGNGRLVLGGWHHPGRFECFDGGTESGTSGFYAIVEQALWRAEPTAEDGPHLGAFLQYGYADPHVSEFEHHLGGGFEWVGPLPGREADVFGAGASWVRLSTQPEAGFDATYELDLEIFYRIQVTPWLAIQPDLHVIVNPGGLSNRDDALIGLVRVDISF